MVFTDLNKERPGPVLAGQTAREVYDADPSPLSAEMQSVTGALESLQSLFSACEPRCACVHSYCLGMLPQAGQPPTLELLLQRLSPFACASAHRARHRIADLLDVILNPQFLSVS